MNFSAYKVMSGFFDDEYQNRYPNTLVNLDQKSRYMDCHNIKSKDLTEEERQEILDKFLTEKNHIALVNLKQELNGYREEKMLALQNVKQ